MTIEELYQAARLRVRKAVSDDLDADVRRVVNTAIADMKRIRIDDSWLSNPSDPLIVETILSYVKANYSIDTNAYPILSGIYDMNITKLKGDSRYFSVAPEPEQEEGGATDDGMSDHIDSSGGEAGG